MSWRVEVGDLTLTGCFVWGPLLLMVVIVLAMCSGGPLR